MLPARGLETPVVVGTGTNPTQGLAGDSVATRPNLLLAPARWLGRLMEEERERLTHRRFWAVQGLVVLLAGLHVLAEGLGLLRHDGALYFLPEALFLVPVGYAALNFGRRGSVLTALWCTVLALPNQFLWHRGVQLQGTLMQLVIVNALAIFVGERVNNEVQARRQAEAARLALEASESRYRSLFETSAEAVLVCDGTGTLRQANRAAAELFARPAELLAGEELAELIGERAARRLLTATGAAEDGELVLTNRRGDPVYVEPVAAPLAAEAGESLAQIFLRDVTRHRNRREEWRTYARFVLHGQEDERRRMAQELHDDVLQSLIILLRHLDAAEEAARRVPAAVGRLKAARLGVEDLVAVVRNFTGKLRPPALEDFGLVSTLRRLLADTAVRSGLRGELEVQGTERRLPADVELGLYRIAQEAVHNVERHASASRLEVSLRFMQDQIELQVVDDGRGFVTASSHRELVERGSLGLMGMEERAALLGSRLHVESWPGRGTRVLVEVPS